MNRKIGLVIFDLDGTLTPVESLWRYLHEALGTWDKGKIAAERYRRGEISYKEWAETDAGCWTGVPLSQLTQSLEQIPYRTGVRAVFRALKEKRIKTGIISAGLSLLADKAARELGADFVLSNELEANHGSLTGRIIVKVAVNDKKEIVEKAAAQLGVPISEVAIVGDRAWDLSHSSCLKIAYKPKDEVAKQRADLIVEDDDLSRILPYLE